MQPIKWDRDTCVRCNMVISDPRFAAELRGGGKDTSFKFDDIGCLVFWLRDKAAHIPGWQNPPRACGSPTATSKSATTWLDARKAHTAAARLSPMGYNFAARGYAVAGSAEVSRKCASKCWQKENRSS
jgi:copper chaperone NosL